jgi:hypothetical protein
MNCAVAAEADVRVSFAASDGVIWNSTSIPPPVMRGVTHNEVTYVIRLRGELGDVPVASL